MGNCHYFGVQFHLIVLSISYLSSQSNYLVFMAELFWWFEVVKPSFVQPRAVCPQGDQSLTFTRSDNRQQGEFVLSHRFF